MIEIKAKDVESVVNECAAVTASLSLATPFAYAVGRSKNKIFKTVYTGILVVGCSGIATHIYNKLQSKPLFSNPDYTIIKIGS